MRYLAGLARALTAGGGRLYEQTRATSVDDMNGGVEVTTSTGSTVRARHAVVAALLPIGMGGGFFARTSPESVARHRRTPASRSADRDGDLDRTFLTTRSIEYDAIVVAAGNPELAHVKLTVLLGELFRHRKVIGAWGDGDQVLAAAGIDTSASGIVLGETVAKPYTTDLLAAVGLHRAWDRTE